MHLDSRGLNLTLPVPFGKILDQEREKRNSFMFKACKEKAVLSAKDIHYAFMQKVMLFKKVFILRLFYDALNVS